jgi:hypothetical protein
MDALQARMRGDTPKPNMPPKREEKGPTTAQETMISDSIKKESESSNNDGSDRGLIGGLQLSYDIGDVEEAAKNLKNSPAFMKKLMAQTVDLDFDSVDDINCTEVAVRLNQIKRADFSFSKRPMPNFSQAEIEEAKRKLKTDPTFLSGLDEEVVGAVKGNDTKLALMGLNYNYFMEIYEEGQLEKLVEGEDWLKGVIDAVNKTAIDASIETIYPKCTRKEDAPVPTMAQVQSLMADVLPKASFTPRGKPEQVVGGYIIRGSSRYENGDDILSAIEEQLSKSNLNDKMTVLVTIDFTLLAQLDEGLLEENVDPDAEPPILYVMGPDIAPERRRIPLALTSALGIASSWYLSIYPFLLNPAIMKRTEEQLALADASMAYDLSWLTELSLPLFFTFMSIQVAHEAGHRLAASVNEVGHVAGNLILEIALLRV